MITSTKSLTPRISSLTLVSITTVTPLKLHEWERFIQLLRWPLLPKGSTKVHIYIASGRYKSVEDLVQENSSEVVIHIATRYHSLQITIKEYNSKRLSATIDYTWNSGKALSFMAQIVLGIGLVDKVLCPSVTIKDELTCGNTELATDVAFVNAIPQATTRRKLASSTQWNNTHRGHLRY